MDELTAVARSEDPEAVVQRGDQTLETKVQGFKVLGAPIGHRDFVAEFLDKKSREHEVLFDRIPAMEDLQSAWLVLLFCAALRANFWLSMVRPEMVAQFAETHDANMWVCLARLIGAEPSLHAQATASLQFSLGGLGLTSAVRGCLAAHWASWTDCLAMINNRHPEVGHINVRAFPASRPSRGLMNSSGGTWKFPRGRNFAERTQPEDDEALEPGLSRHGWQKTAHICFENRVACTGQHRQSHVKIPTRAPRGHSLRVPPFESVFQVRPAVVQVAPSTPPPSSHSLVFQILQVWPPTRPTWPPPRGMLRSCSFETRIPFWKRQCAVKLEEGLLRTSWSKTWTWQCSTTSMAAGWKWWRMDSHCGTDRSWRLTRRWSLPCTVMEQRDGGQQTTTGSHWSTHGTEKRRRTQNSLVKWVAPDWSFWTQRWVDGSPLKRRLS